MRAVPQIALDFLRQAEAVKLTAYRDSRGTWTIGVGHTGPEVVEGLTITTAQMVSYLYADATKAAVRLAMVVKEPVIEGLSEHQYAALVSFVFNLGERPSWQIWGLLNTGKLAQVPDQMMLFDKEHLPSGKVVEVPGLHNRRAAEVTLWKTADVGAAVAVAQAAPVAPPPSSYLRDAETPPGAAPQRPLHEQKSFISTCLGSLAAGGLVWSDRLKDGVSWLKGIMPDAGGSEIITHINTELPVAILALTLASAGFLALRQHLAKNP